MLHALLRYRITSHVCWLSLVLTKDGLTLVLGIPTIAEALNHAVAATPSIMGVVHRRDGVDEIARRTSYLL